MRVLIAPHFANIWKWSALNFGHSDLESHCGFTFHSPNNDVEHISCAYWPFVYHLCKVPFHIFHPSLYQPVFLLSCFQNSWFCIQILCIQKYINIQIFIFVYYKYTNPFIFHTNMKYANIFSQSVSCVLILLTLSFKEQKFFSLVKLNLLTFLINGALILLPRTLSITQGQRYSPVFSSRSFIDLFYF